MTIDPESVIPTTSTLSLAEFEQFGRNNALRSEATFRVLLMSMTSDPVAIETAMRGRREALEQGDY
jgi:hypothetical protein